MDHTRRDRRGKANASRSTVSATRAGAIATVGTGTAWMALAMCVSVAVAGVAEAITPAFPGAEGFGAMTRGGRGGRVLRVTSLDDYAPGRDRPVAGSLRAACEAKGPRTVVFRVSGTIRLKAPLKITEAYLTLAGQSAPGGGICLKDYGTSVHSNEVIIRYLRFRPGDAIGRRMRAEGRSWETDALSIGGPSRNIIFDHCSTSWANDEVLSVSGAGITGVTVQWCIISESLNESTHGKGKHGYGSLLRTNGKVTFCHNLYAHHASRSPRPGTYGEGSILLDFRNNVIYNSTGYSAADPVRMNYVGNYIKRARGNVFSVGGEATRMFVEGNYLEGGGDRNADNWRLISHAKAINRLPEALATAQATIETARVAYDRVLRECGAILPKRDTVDARIIEDVRTGKGDLINTPEQVGGWPPLEEGRAPADTDGDGMPNDWEERYGLNPNSSDDGPADEDHDGYTNVEEWLNGTNPTKAELQTPVGR